MWVVIGFAPTHLSLCDAELIREAELIRDFQYLVVRDQYESELLTKFGQDSRSLIHDPHNGQRTISYQCTMYEAIYGGSQWIDDWPP